MTGQERDKVIPKAEAIAVNKYGNKDAYLKVIVEDIRDLQDIVLDALSEKGII